MADLVAKQSIQVGFRRYQPGDILPSDDPLANAWVECGSAVWREEAPKAKPTARLVTAEPGLPGMAVGGEVTGYELVGKVPLTSGRGTG